MGKPINVLNEWFRRGRKPSQDQFWELFDSYWHKDSSIPKEKVTGLNSSLDNKVDKNVYDSHLTELSKKLNKPLAYGAFIVRNSESGTIYTNINPAANYLMFWDGLDFKESNVYHQNSKIGIGTQAPTELIHVNGRLRSKAIVLDNNSEQISGQVTYFNNRFRGTDSTGVGRDFMYFDFSDYKNLWQGFSDAQKNEMRSFLNISDGYKASLKRSTPSPTISGLYRLLEMGSYPNLSPAEDENGNPTILTAIDGKINDAYFDGSKWFLSKITIPGTSAKPTYDPVDNVNPATMKAGADRWDNTLVALSSFLHPEGDGPWETMPFPSTEYQGYILNQNAVGEANQYGAWGEFQAVDVAGVDSLRITGPNMDQYGGTIAWWIGFRPDNTFDVLKMGLIANGVAQIKLDPQYKYYKYSRPINGAKLEKRSKIALPVESDGVMKTIKSLGSGYSGILDLGTVGVKESNTAAQNTQIINDIIENESKKTVQRVIKFPPGIFMVNEIIMQPNISLTGAGDVLTVLRTDIGSTARYIINLPDGRVNRGLIADLLIDGKNATEGAVYINNTFDFEITNCIIEGGVKYGIKMVGGLYHTMSNIYLVGGDISLITDHVTGSMGTNLIKYDRLYIVKSKKKCVEINGGSNYHFSHCNFEDSGTSGDENTGGVHAIGVSPGGEGVDVVFNNCWAEGVRGGFVYKIDNCKGNSVIRDCMLGNGGNGVETITNAIVNVGSNLVLSGATRFSTAPHFQPFPTNVRTIASITYVDNPNINIGINNVGTLKIAQYS
ncbi:hypothetical protein EGY05_08295 [Chryseobacterium arthrosphaerae]|uniref:hypothetical protein n=1 Tax=Chryseobacterium arthrosphaerae TaxID=651561 RepID=UPI000F517569|nr:hypothetical protein [Chryseobacterium arthrosphaerae]AYZ11926.1 hypothetical protein EGY05_08295 [Chryseobacterium arthrosphaerae]